jgi:serine phosphatase RsbU (regulator of sigma subunit)
VRETARVMRCTFCSLRLYDPQSNDLTTAATYRLSQRYLDKGKVTRAEGSIDDEALKGSVVYVENMATDPRIQYPEDAVREGIVSCLTAGMVYRGSPVGVLRVYTDRKQRFRAAQRQLLRAVAYQAATAVVHAQLVTERLRAAETRRQLEIAGQVQARMVSSPLPPNERLDVGRIFMPSRHIGGDYCDYLSLPDGRFVAVVADVVGKGIPGALLMASVRTALRSIAESTNRLDEIMTRLNRYMCAETATGEFITLLLVAIDAAAGEITYSSAGHEPLLILRDSTINCLEQGGLVLGVNPDEVYEEHAARIDRGANLFLYSDGVIEALNFDGELFGRDRLRESLLRHDGESAQEMLNQVLWDIRRFIGLAEQADDMTMLAVKLV